MYKRKKIKLISSTIMTSLITTCLLSIPLKVEGATLEGIKSMESQVSMIENKNVQASNSNDQLKLSLNSSMNKESLKKYRDGEFIVKFKDSANAESSNNRESMKIEENKDIKALDIEILSDKDLGDGFKLVKYNGNKTPKELDKITKANNNNEIEYIEPNYILTASDIKANWVPSDPYYNNLWGLKNTGQFIPWQNGTAGIDINAEKAWDITKGSSNVVVAVIDTGVDYNHSDLYNNMWKNTREIPNNYIDDDGNGYVDDFNGWDFYNYDNNPMDDNGHGTHVSGTIAASGNSTGVIGVAPNVKIMPLKFLNSNGSGFLSDAISAINYAKKMGAKISNNSWGGGGYSQALYDSIKNYGGLFVAAAGNQGVNNDLYNTYPASYDLPNILSVAAIDNKGSLASFSNYGFSSVDVAAPGVEIYSTMPNNSYQYLSGTSMATPHVTGVAALLLSLNQSSTTTNLKDSITKSVVKLSSLNGKVATSGMINAYSAIRQIAPMPAVPASPTAISAGYNSIKISWGAVAGASGYEVYRSASSTGAYGLVTTTASTSFTNTGLATGTSYYYKVRAYRIVGTTKIYGGYSAVVGAKPVPIVPISTIAASAGYNSIKTSWGAVAGASGYEVYRSGTSTGTYSLVATTASTSFINTGLVTGTAYYYKVRAYTMVGTTKAYGGYSVVVGAKPVPVVPLNQAAASAGYNSIKTSWGAVAGASGYEVYRSGTSTGTYTLVTTTTSTSFINTGLVTGSAYYYKVRAYTMVGTTKVYGAYSVVVGAKPVPAVPLNQAAVSSGYNSIKTSWGAVAGASGYEVYRSGTSTGTYSLVGTTASTSFINTGLATGSAYYYKVRAYTMVGTTKVYGVYSAVVGTKPVPAVPLNQAAVSAGYNSIKTSWGAVAGASGYEVYRSGTSTGTYSLVATAASTSFINTGLTTGTAYYYKVRAYTMAGTTKVYGAYSTVIGAKPVPVAPLSPTAVSAGYNSIKTSWGAVAGASGYEVYRSGTSTGTYTLVTTTTSTSFTNTGLITGTAYYYKVRAYTMVGTTKVYGDYSAIVSTKPQV